MATDQRARPASRPMCTNCGTQWGERTAPPDDCPICTDDRQYVAPTGQAWTTHEELAAAHEVRIEPDGDLIGKIHLPEACANICFGGAKKNRLFMAGSQSIYAGLEFQVRRKERWCVLGANGPFYEANKDAIRRLLDADQRLLTQYVIGRDIADDIGATERLCRLKHQSAGAGEAGNRCRHEAGFGDCRSGR